MDKPFGTRALIIGIIATLLALFLSGWGLYLPLGIVAIILGAIGIKKEYPITLAMIGLIFGISAIVLGLLFFLLLPPLPPLTYPN